MKKIRIGNDIRLKLKIDGIDNVTSADIKQVRCYLINTTFGKDQKEAEMKHARRFTREVFPEFYIPSAYNTHCCERPAYHVHPANVCHYDKFLPDFHDYHWWPGFKGFGLHPDKFQRYHRLFDPCCQRLEHYEHPFVTGPDRVSTPWYLTEAEVLNTTNTLSCIFPANEQHGLGIYKLVVVLVLFEQGWGKHNLRTYTIDKGEIFELVDDYTGESGNITISVDDSGDRESVVSSIYVDNYSYTLIDGDTMQIGEFDIDHKMYNIRAILKDGTEAVYNPYDWRLDQFEFESSDESIVSVDRYGTLYAHGLPHGVDQQSASITVFDKYNTDVSYVFNVMVKNSEAVLKIGFSSADDYNDINMNDVHSYDYNQSYDYVINNDADGKYLWIMSQREINNVESSGFYVPMLEPAIKNGFYFYRSAAAVLKGDMKIVIKYKHYEQ